MASLVSRQVSVSPSFSTASVLLPHGLAKLRQFRSRRPYRDGFAADRPTLTVSTAPTPLTAMVLLIGNFPPDQQQSMQRFSEMILRELPELGIAAELTRPEAHFARFVPTQFVFLSKWAGYIDKFIIFPRRLRKLPGVELIHICDHSNAFYSKYFPDVPVVVTCHDLLAVRGALGEETDCPASWTGRILQRWIVAGLSRARAVVCVSSATAADAIRLIGTSKNGPSIDVIENGLNYRYRPLPEEKVKARLGKVSQLKLDRPFVLMRHRCRTSPVAQPCCAISPMKMDSRKICCGCAIRRRAKNIVSSVCRMPRASAQKEWRNNISRFIGDWEWPHEEFSPAHFAAVAVANAARVSGAAIWFSDSSHCSHWSGLGFAFAFDHGREHQH